MGTAINCILPDDIYKRVLKRKTQLQNQKPAENVTLTDAVIAVLEDGFRY